MPTPLARLPMLVVGLGLALGACDTHPTTYVEIENAYAPSSGLVIYRAAYKEVAFADAIAPQASSSPQATVPASANDAYVLLAPGWDPTSATTPTGFVVL